MSLFKRILVMAALAAPTLAQGAVRNGSEWSDGRGLLVTVQVTDSPTKPGKVDVTFITNTSGFSSAVTGNKGPGPVTSATYTPAAATTGGLYSLKVADPVGLVPCSVCAQSGPGKPWVPLKPVVKKTHRRPPVRSWAAPGLNMGGPQSGGSLPGGPKGPQAP